MNADDPGRIHRRTTSASARGEEDQPGRDDASADESERDPSEPRAGSTRLSAAEIHENVLESAREEMLRPASELAWSAVAAGLTIGFSFIAPAYLASLLPARYTSIAVAAGYPLGFIFVVQARSQLFTENTLEPVIPVLHDRTRRSLLRLLRLWSIVLLGNMVGALMFATALALTPAIAETLRPQLIEIASKATFGTFWEIAYGAVFGGWLVALMAWMVSSTHFTTAQIIYIWLTTASIAAFGFRHSIAGAVEAFYLAMSGLAPWADMVLGFIVPALLGNIVGGVVLVALLNYGQVAPVRGRWVKPAAYRD